MATATHQFNLPLYKLLLKQGATEPEAEAAATFGTDLTTFATKTDLQAGLSDLKSSLLMWIIVVEIAQTTLLLTVLRMLSTP